MRYPIASVQILLLVLLTIPIFAQRIENVKPIVLGETIEITYDIVGATEGQKFKLQLFGSHNNYSAPILLVRGDIGLENPLTAGTNKRIIWDAKKELKDFDGDITFEIRGEIIAAPYALLSPIGGTFKRKKKIEIKWKGGRAGENVSLELVKAGVATTVIGQTTNVGAYTWQIPKTTAKGTDYQVRLTANDKTVISNNFRIKKGGGFVKVVLPMIVVGGAVYVITQLGGHKKDNSLPAPIEPN